MIELFAYLVYLLFFDEIGTNGLVPQTPMNSNRDAEDASLLIKNKQMNPGGIDLSKSSGSDINHLVSASLKDSNRREGIFSISSLSLYYIFFKCWRI